MFQENEVKKGNEEKKKKNKKNKRVFKEEIRDRSGAVVEAGEAMFQVVSLSPSSSFEYETVVFKLLGSELQKGRGKFNII